ncbi:MAG: hypothetical protein KC503_02075 [Myxococcales bacterium]|nr:hypothetical protein [Myxococcales bacterium]
MSRSHTLIACFALAAMWPETLLASHASRAPLPKIQKAKPKPDPVVSIALRRTMCFGSCPAYTVLLRRDGTADYHGRSYAPRTGHHKGALHPWRFEQLAKLLAHLGFFKLNDSYRARVTCQSSTYVTVTRRSGKTKTVQEYGSAAPVALWGIRQAIDGVAQRIMWRPTVMAKVPSRRVVNAQMVRSALLARINAQRAKHKRPKLSAVAALDYWADADARAKLGQGSPQPGRRYGVHITRQLGTASIAARDTYCALARDPRQIALRFGKHWPLSDNKLSRIGIGSAYDASRGWCVVLLLGR